MVTGNPDGHSSSISQRMEEPGASLLGRPRPVRSPAQFGDQDRRPRTLEPRGLLHQRCPRAQRAPANTQFRRGHMRQRGVWGSCTGCLGPTLGTCAWALGPPLPPSAALRRPPQAQLSLLAVLPAGTRGMWGPNQPLPSPRQTGQEPAWGREGEVDVVSMWMGHAVFLRGKRSHSQTHGPGLLLSCRRREKSSAVAASESALSGRGELRRPSGLILMKHEEI